MRLVVDTVDRRPLWRELVGARWREGLVDASLRDLPYKVETNSRQKFASRASCHRNAESELMAKVRLYLDAGAHEAWLVDSKGGVRLYGPDGSLATSRFDVDVAAVAFEVSKGDR